MDTEIEVRKMECKEIRVDIRNPAKVIKMLDKEKFQED